MMLSAVGLSKSFGGLRVVDDVSVEVEAGTCLGIMGPNGAGKSTFFDLLTGTTRADAGKVAVDGQDVTGAAVADRVKAGLARAFQIPRPFESLTVFETLRLAQHSVLGLWGPAADRTADDILARVGLDTQAKTPGGALRLLDRKRLELAKALACRPKVLLLDEVSGGLTSEEVDQMIEIVAELKSRGLAILWVEHIAHALQKVSDRVMMLHMGAKLIEDTPEAVSSDPDVQELYLGTQK